MNTVETYENIVDAIIDEYELDYGNAETGAQNNSLLIRVEAPNHATIGVDVEIESTNKEEIRKQILRAIAKEMRMFDAEDEFEMLWSPEFITHNKFTTFQFVKMLQEDEEFFENTADEMLRNL